LLFDDILYFAFSRHTLEARMASIPQGRSLRWLNSLMWLIIAGSLPVLLAPGALAMIPRRWRAEPWPWTLGWMPVFIVAATLAVLFVCGSLVYVYRFRGKQRFAGVSEYVRKGWPIFTPLNCLLYAMTQRRAQQPIMDLSQFSELAEITANWQTIRDEGMKLLQSGCIEATSKPGSQAYYDIGFRTFYKYGWRKFYLKWYGYTHNSARQFCPKTVEILSQVPTVNGAMFSLLPAGSHLTRHLDPVACSLRFHLGLDTPESDACFINIDGQTYSWRNGQALLFDETYLHYARNDSPRDRLILMCDVDRPMNPVGKLVNGLYKMLMRLSIVPNVEGDRRGFFNLVFSSLSPLLARLKTLKSTHRRRYLFIKYAINFTLLAAGVGIVAGLSFLASWLVAVIAA
jgi:beta-hydroxylase